MLSSIKDLLPENICLNLFFLFLNLFFLIHPSGIKQNIFEEASLVTILKLSLANVIEMKTYETGPFWKTAVPSF